MTETQKLAAILAADIVGYSRLMGEDEAGTARAVRERRIAPPPPETRGESPARARRGSRTGRASERSRSCESRRRSRRRSAAIRAAALAHEGRQRQEAVAPGRPRFGDDRAVRSRRDIGEAFAGGAR